MSLFKHWLFWTNFYRCDAMLVRVYAIAFPSVCVSHTCFVSKQLNVYHLIAHHSSFSWPRVIAQGLLLNSNGFIPNGAPNTKGGEKIGWFLTNKLVYLRNGARYDHCYYGSGIGNHTQAIKRWHFWWPWVTQNFNVTHNSKVNILQTVHATATVTIEL